ncbi:MFS transporter [Pseudarthrobacter sp. P1]|uniref:MFS transporter n=1 Tax=Pseudarthrobacter sp. P1 TaxID=3418418 RepID=UPI003CF45ED6
MPSHLATRTPTPEKTRKPTGLIVTILCLCGTVVALQQTLVVPLLPDFPKILNTSADDVSWLVTATLLTSAVATPIVSRLADMYGKRRMMIVAMAMMVAGSVIAALGGSFLWLVVGRSFQGFAASLIPVGISIMRDELPREKVASAVALMSATLGIGSALGLPMSGIIYEQFGWEAIFWVSAAVGVLLIAAVLSIVPESAVRTRGKFDVVGALLLSVALTSLLLAISKGGSWGWGSEPVILLFLGTAVVLAFWFPYELRASQPMVDLRTSARRPVLLTNIASVLVGFSMYANMLSTTQQLQMPKISGYGFELSVVVAGLCMVPSGLAMVALAPVSAAITKRFGAKATLIVGASVLAGAYVARVFLTDAVWMVIVGATVVSMGTAIAYAAMPTLIMRSVPITETASANGLNSLLRAVGTSTASATVAAVLTAVTIHVGGVALPSLDAFKDIFWYAAVAALLAIGVSVFIPKFHPAAAAPAAAAVGTGTVPAVRPATAAEPITSSSAASDTEIVVGGTVVRADLRPLRHAVVSAHHTNGEPADWSRADNDGKYSMVLPSPGRYLVVSSADGWSPHSQVLEFADSSSVQQIRLSQRLTLSGTVQSAGAPAEGALVALTRHSGESVSWAHTGTGGRYQLPLPAAGGYILTVLDPAGSQAQARPVVVGAQSAVVDFDTADVHDADRVAP